MTSNLLDEYTGNFVYKQSGMNEQVFNEKPLTCEQLMTFDNPLIYLQLITYQQP